MSQTPSTPSDSPPPHRDTAGAVRTAIEIAIRLGVVFLIVALCLQIVAPFLGIVVWALIIAIAADKPFEKLCQWTGGRRSLTAAVLVTVVVVALAVPMIMLSDTLISGARNFSSELESGEIELDPPPDRVAEWPLVGERLYDFWKLASENAEEAAERISPQLKAISRWLLKAAGNAGVGILQLLASLVIAGFMLARSEGRHRAIVHFASRLAGERRGEEFADLASATVQSVVNGILGVALIQSVLAGIGFMVAGVPAAGLWALLVLISAVVQLPVALVMVPPVALAFSSLSPAAAGLFTVYCLAVALIDNFLKPILFGRGVQVPALVIFLGAIGGMISMGIVGLFLGAVVLALGYELFKAWLDDPSAAAEAARPEST